MNPRRKSWTRLGLMLLVLVMVAGAGLWLHYDNSGYSAVTEFEQRLEASLQSGDPTSALSLLERANQYDPAGAAIRNELFRKRMSYFWMVEFKTDGTPKGTAKQESVGLETFGKQLNASFKAGDPTRSFLLLERANMLDPLNAALRTGRFAGVFDLYWNYEFMSGRRAAGLISPDLASNPFRARRAAPSPLSLMSVGSAAIVYVSNSKQPPPFDAVYEEYLRLLGYPSVERINPQEAGSIGERQQVVVAPDPTLQLPDSISSALYLAPNRQAERRLAIQKRKSSFDQASHTDRRKSAGAVGSSVNDIKGEPQTRSLCRLETIHKAFDAVPGQPIDVYLPVPVTQYEDVGTCEVLAHAICGDRRLPAILRSADKATTMFAFNLPKALIFWRQGNPLLAGRESDFSPGLRPSDLFDQQRTVEGLRLPHADLLVEGLLRLQSEGKPRLRLWHHRSGSSGTLVLTSDMDSETYWKVVHMAMALRQRGLRSTVFVTDYNRDKSRIARDPNTEKLFKWLKKNGVHRGAHPDFRGVKPAKVDDFLTKDVQYYVETFDVPPESGRIHFVKWWGWIDPVFALEKAGWHWDLSYTTLVSPVQPSLGYMTGSGLGLRYYNEYGRATGIRQLATQIDDHPHPEFSIEVLHETSRFKSMDAFVAMTVGLLQASAEKYHGALILNHHPRQFYAAPEWMLTTVQRAEELGLDIVDLRDYTEFVDGLITSEIRRVKPLGYIVLIQNPKQEILITGASGEIRVDGTASSPRRVRRFGRPFRMLSLNRGEHRIDISL